MTKGLKVLCVLNLLTLILVTLLLVVHWPSISFSSVGADEAGGIEIGVGGVDRQDDLGWSYSAEAMAGTLYLYGGGAVPGRLDLWE